MAFRQHIFILLFVTVFLLFKAGLRGKPADSILQHFLLELKDLRKKVQLFTIDDICSNVQVTLAHSELQVL